MILDEQRLAAAVYLRMTGVLTGNDRVSCFLIDVLNSTSRFAAI
jgi:hypothetical protein